MANEPSTGRGRRLIAEMEKQLANSRATIAQVDKTIRANQACLNRAARSGLAPSGRSAGRARQTKV